MKLLSMKTISLAPKQKCSFLLSPLDFKRLTSRFGKIKERERKSKNEKKPKARESQENLVAAFPTIKKWMAYPLQLALGK